jgi:cell division protease FtsH
MKYESIDGKQIDQIMEGREPDPPAGWNDIEPEVKASTPDADEKEARSTIGGPAEQV